MSAKSMANLQTRLIKTVKPLRDLTPYLEPCVKEKPSITVASCKVEFRDLEMFDIYLKNSVEFIADLIDFPFVIRPGNCDDIQGWLFTEEGYTNICFVWEAGEFIFGGRRAYDAMESSFRIYGYPVEMYTWPTYLGY